MNTPWKAPFIHILVLMAVGLFATCTTIQPPTPEEPPTVTEGPTASFVFQGTVSEARSSTVDQLPAERGNYVVRVDDVFYREGSYDDPGGDHITVVASQDTLRTGSQYVMYAEPFMFGSSIAVRLVRATRDGRTAAEIREEVRLARERQELAERVRLAEAIVVGTVARTGSTQREPRFESEHDPMLRRAVLEVDRTLKGNQREEMVVFYSASRDVQWYRAPKLRPEDRGVFLLNRGGENASRLDIDDSQFTLLHPLDFQPLEQLPVIEGLLQ